MLYMRFTPVALNRWDASVPAKSPKPIAKVQVSGSSVTVATKRPITREELEMVSMFMKDRTR